MTIDIVTNLTKAIDHLDGEIKALEAQASEKRSVVHALHTVGWELPWGLKAVGDSLDAPRALLNREIDALEAAITEKRIAVSTLKRARWNFVPEGSIAGLIQPARSVNITSGSIKATFEGQPQI